MSFRWMKSTILILEAFILLESAYQEVDFYGDFKPGDLKLYDNFKLNFERLLNNEVPFTRKSTGERMHLQEFDKLTYHEVFNPRNISYRFFDMYEDGTPELGIGAETCLLYTSDAADEL